ncbi:bifunctional diaminohydroxyphosphoribosylaminopyrimidine deaminase/5-amino-6-(5-phosphoribosylamino)uracil reductase RibD [Shewanella gelidimarina]|uniref:bifunctional diaminohydroxyphosphoribosylaminopyrimidine deaminase/5-amino-6-(5-phosphoribosylamino)uracil reductase RibD n=1 Tax=Shewanella gelidimarina TaxID=56813 RepID=UPI00200C61EB|nr:bifunctional diaminohydroxyphosphoribosylaminopyrimidine deaminase/5-amino-6-(5-phosphoribosylamino)uracil reductase RibD [Shewanella gelidimarina]MCL1058947.1 bifunctional diaminohydroxyphosphoribosylaminopyrimidine deaminase/5-amino-6-(5-phosphoribosylamino)uracil reductase RibD [Shewanella gelidimarina]
MWSTEDNQMMSLAIELAQKGLYTTRPNPCVGSVLVKDGVIVGEGYHIRAGGPHAEVYALNMAGDDAIGATAYVTLEPCSHYGRTPPCAKALIESKVSRVVIAVTDPNPQISGRGITMLRDAGIQVDVGLLTDAAKQVNLGFLKRMEQGLPWVTVKLAASLDGKTALSNGESKWITGPEARRDVQRVRARHCALITGVETVLADNPSLNVRHSELGSLSNEIAPAELHQPMRVVLDSQARLGADLKLFSINSPILLISTCDYPEKVKSAWPAHVSHQILAAKDKRVDLSALLVFLGKSCNSVLVEAGATLAGAFVSEQLADEIILYQAMKILGAQGRDLLALPSFETMSQIPSINVIDERKVGKDTRLTLRMSN